MTMALAYCSVFWENDPIGGLERSPLISPRAIVLIGGLISSTLLSRLVTPVLYYLIPSKVS